MGELKLGEDNSDLIQVHPDFNSVSSLRPSVRVLAIEIFFKNSGREHANAHIILG